MDGIFKEGDRVFDIRRGWGIVCKIDIDFIEVEFKNKKGNNLAVWYENDYSLSFLSFTEYTLEGFSQERPEPLPNKGQIVWGRDHEFQSWHIYHFSHKAEDGIYHLSSDNKRNMFRLKQITTENPYANEQ
jgi:hypothetical protein